MSLSSSLKLAAVGDRQIVITREFNAARHLVFDAYTKPEILKRWLTGPPGWSFLVCDVDLRVGGNYRYVWKNEDGREMGMGGTYREIAPPDRIVSTELFDEDWTGGETQVTADFIEHAGKTTLSLTILYQSMAARDAVLKSPMEHGLAAGYNRLEKLLALRTRRVGEFCWINMVTPEPAAARAFFEKLLGWTYFEMPGIGHGIRVDGRDIGGLFDLNGPQTPPGTPPMIGVMVKVENADAASEKVTALGGKAMPPFDIMDAGRMAVCFDPNGANLDLWQPKNMHGTDVDASLHGAPSWFETITTDVDRATRFYSGLFGWTPEVMSMPGMNYTVFKQGSEPVAGMMQVTPEMGALPAHWGVYFTVTDADETARLAVELGATLCVPPRDIPNVGRFCGITSPQGVMFYVIKYSR